MKRAHLSLHETKKMFLFLSEKMIASKDILTQADKVIGDGDHEIGMALGFETVQKELTDKEFQSLGALMKTIGFALMNSIGGASGAIFGTLFLGAASKTQDQKILDAKALSLILINGLESVKKRGKAKPGDKTMVDALEPAALVSETTSQLSLEEALLAVIGAAKEGMESTKEMVATIGRAKSLGERSLGHPDPGAISIHLIFTFMLEYVVLVD